MKELSTAMLSNVQGVLTCQACQSALVEFIDAQLTEPEIDEQFADLKVHLKVCPACAQEYNELVAITRQAYTEILPDPTYQPAFDFAFLEKEPKRTHWWNELGQLVISLSEEVVNAVQATVKPTYAGVRSRTTERQLLQLTTKEADEELSVDIRLREADNPAQYTLLIEVDIPNRGGWPNLGGIEIALKQREHEIDKQMTDPFGQTVFEGISIDGLAELSFEIDPGQ